MEHAFDSLSTEQRNPFSSAIDKLRTVDVLRVINGEDQAVASAVSAQVEEIGRAVDAIVAALRRGRRLFYVGAGTSGRLGVLDAAECSPTYSVPPDVVQGIIAGGESALARATEASEDDPEAGATDLRSRGFGPGDVLCGIAASGRTPYVLGAIGEAKRLGCTTIGISCVSNSRLSACVDFPIAPITGPEVVTGSTRMKAGTATKLVLNMLTTATMIRLGYTYGNLMVNVQPKNEKLRDRAQRIICEAARVDSAEALRLLAESGDSVRTAIVMGRLGVGRGEAEKLLSDNGNVVARALGEDKE